MLHLCDMLKHCSTFYLKETSAWIEVINTCIQSLSKQQISFPIFMINHNFRFYCFWLFLVNTCIVYITYTVSLFRILLCFLIIFNKFSFSFTVVHQTKFMTRDFRFLFNFLLPIPYLIWMNDCHALHSLQLAKLQK